MYVKELVEDKLYGEGFALIFPRVLRKTEWMTTAIQRKAELVDGWLDFGQEG